MSEATSPNERLEALRRLMAERSIEAWLAPTEDPHMSEYVPECWRRREWISGLTGSAGFAVIGKESAWLWADSRYWLQAEEELDAEAGWELVKMGHPATETWPDWCVSPAWASARPNAWWWSSATNSRICCCPGAPRPRLTHKSPPASPWRRCARR